MSSPVSASGAGYAAAGLRSSVLPRLLWVALFTLSMLIGLGGRALTEPDEGRSAEIAREMLASGDYIVPHFNALPHPDKPVGYPVLLAASFRLLGATAFSARLPSALATLLTVLLTGALARRLFGPGAGLIAAGALLVSPLTWCYGQLAILDPLFTLWVLAAVTAFYLAVEAASSARPQRRLAWSLTAWVAIAAAVLTKGPLGLLLPLLIMAPYARFRRQATAVLDWRGALLATALVLPWVWVISSRLPGFLHYVVQVEIWDRLAGGAILHRDKPFWYFVPMLLVGAFPWSAVAVSAALRALRVRPRTLDPRWVLLALWILPPLVFFSLLSSKLPHYVLPLMPAFALLAAGLWVRLPAQALPGLRGASWAWVGFGAACAVVPFLPLVRQLGEPLHSEALVLALVGCAAGLGAGVMGLAERTGDATSALWIVSSPMLLLYVAAQPFLTSLSDVFSSRDMAQAIHAALPAGGEVIGVRALPTALPFYLRQPIQLASANGSELTSNYLDLTYPRWEGASPLHPAAYWQGVVQTCHHATVFVTNAWDDKVHKALIAARLPLLARNTWYEVYGPCAVEGR